MDVSVLERQRAVLQRIYQDQHPHHHLDMDSSPHHPHQLLWHHDQQRRSCSDNSSLTSPPIPQCNSSSTDKQAMPIKRKAQFDIEKETEEEKSDITTKTERETSANTSSKQDYIHVRARRGEATDSHSLAERARREKISKKMKCLQDLVPGCNKVTGKAGMLEEIINYVQSLQKQVEFLSMKLAAVNPRLDFSIDNFFAKEIPAYIASLPVEGTNSACFQYNPMQLMDQSQSQSHQILSPKQGTSSLQIPEVFLEYSSCISQLQQLSGWDPDWQNLFSAGFQ